MGPCVNLREIAAAILAGSGEVSRYVSRPDVSGTCRTVWPGVTITQAQYFELLRLCRRTDLTPEQMRGRDAHARAISGHN
jgi:hypothetical protein